MEQRPFGRCLFGLVRGARRIRVSKRKADAVADND
jgi:hypothetical protein